MPLGRVIGRALDLHAEIAVLLLEAIDLPREDLPFGTDRAARDPQDGALPGRAATAHAEEDQEEKENPH
jgi:hypothetical protein